MLRSEGSRVRWVSDQHASHIVGEELTGELDRAATQPVKLQRVANKDEAALMGWHGEYHWLCPWPLPKSPAVQDLLVIETGIIRLSQLQVTMEADDLNCPLITAGPSPELKGPIFSTFTWHWLRSFVSLGKGKTIESFSVKLNLQSF
ncbi:hypothetical protein L7F22_021828 [Adiantum nelumboides]|nr:hypothetical protein [Adiantum nelumboides]